MTRKRQHKPKSAYQTQRKQHRKKSNRHVVTFEAKLSPEDTDEILRINRTVAYIGRRITAAARKRLQQLQRRNDYKELTAQYASIKKKQENNDDEALEQERKSLAKQMTAIQKAVGLTFDDLRHIGADYAKLQGIDAVFTLTRCEDIWAGVEKVLYGNGKKIHSHDDYYDLPVLRAKQPNRCIVISQRQGRLWFSLRRHGTRKGNRLSKKELERKAQDERAWKANQRMSFSVRVPDNDTWLVDEQRHIARFIANAEALEHDAVNRFVKTGEVQDTFRPCYAALSCEHIRGVWRIFVQVTVEGRSLPKLKKDGSPRHKLGSGRMGVDLGPSSYAASADGFFEMKSLAERDGRSSYENEAKQRRLQRKMDRSRRAMNPEYYNENGTIKKGKKRWRHSKGYSRAQAAYHDLCRTNRVNREYAIREDVNRLREHASVVVSEQQSVESWKKRAKESKRYIDSRGRVRMSSRKRMGRSVQNRCPGLFRELLRERFVLYVEVDRMFRASQYDHVSGLYVKKPLGQRVHRFPDGRGSPRDGYSSFLLWCSDDGYQRVDRGLCFERFDGWFSLVGSFVSDCKRRGIHVANGGF